MNLHKLKQSKIQFQSAKRCEPQKCVAVRPTFPGYEVIQIPADGDCMFSAIAHQLSLGTDRPPLPARMIRTELCNYIKSNPSVTVPATEAGTLAYY